MLVLLLMWLFFMSDAPSSHYCCFSLIGILIRFVSSLFLQYAGLSAYSYRIFLRSTFIIPKTNHGKHFALKLCTHRELAPPSVLVTPEILIWHLIA